MNGYLGNSYWKHGDNLEVVRGKKFKIGLKGKAFWYGPGYYKKYRAGMELENGDKIFIDAYNVKNHSYEAREEARIKEHNAKIEARKLAAEAAAKHYSEPRYGKSHMSGWMDSHEVELDLLNPHLSVGEIEEELKLLFPVWSGGAALRWRSSISDIKVDYAKLKVSFVDNISLAD